MADQVQQQLSPSDYDHLSYFRDLMSLVGMAPMRGSEEPTVPMQTIPNIPQSTAQPMRGMVSRLYRDKSPEQLKYLAEFGAPSNPQTFLQATRMGYAQQAPNNLTPQ